MFDNLTDKFQKIFRKISGQAVISESNVSEAMKEVKNALLDADVNYKVVNEFTEEVQKACLGTEVLKSITPGQQFIKIVYDHLVQLMGESNAPINLSGNPAVIMMVGLHGSGKTTSSAKLASFLKKKGRNPLLVAGDVYRPAAIDQLEILGKEIGAPVYSERSLKNVPFIAQNAISKANSENHDTIIMDTAGRLQIDNDMVMELIQLKQVLKPSEILLVADAALGQEAVSVADHFHKALDITGILLTKLDGDARGGSALSMRKVTSCPIKFIGIGEKITDIEPFHPERMASRILGMGDIVSLVEKAAEEIDKQEAEKIREKILSKSFDFNDFLSHLSQMKKMGGLESILKMLPGGSQLASMPGMDSSQLVSMEAIIQSMTKKERENPDLIDFSRKKRISKGSGTSLEAVNDLVKQFDMMRKLMKQTSLIKKLMGGGMAQELMGGIGQSLSAGRISRGSNYTPPKKKRRR